MFKTKIENFKNKELRKLYDEMYLKCPEDKKELFNLIMIEADCGCRFVERLQKYIPEVLDNDGKIIVKTDDIRLLNDILSSIVGHFNEKQNNFKLETINFKIDTEE